MIEEVPDVSLRATSVRIASREEDTYMARPDFVAARSNASVPAWFRWLYAHRKIIDTVRTRVERTSAYMKT